MKKRISRKEWEYIGKYNPAAKWLRPFCSYTLHEEGIHFRRECKIGWVAYIIMFIPVHILQALWCCWDGGLREFSIEGRNLGYDVIYKYENEYNGAWEKAKEIWEK